MMVRTLIGAAAICAASGASAATLDFIAEAAGNERGVASGTTLTFDGLDVTFTSNFNPYFDDLSNGLPAGLGVCKVLDANDQCDPSNDDNIQNPEWVALSFDASQDVLLDSFYDVQHMSLGTSVDTLDITVNGGAAQTFTFADALTTVFQDVDTIRFDALGTQFYIGGATATPTPGVEGQIPLPAGAWLLLTALGAMGVASRRSKA